MKPEGQRRARTAYVGHQNGRDVRCDAQGCPAGCGLSGATPLGRMGDRGRHSKAS
ncbi:UNVERIFIED_CONTAM: hypothetical protein Sradi_0181600 [Sesamum radiatum]|uniref:Uncharacterized protein n=1 Tax=Sesamum radiatum TaxID=300843 RepID=A0AAW2VZA0_SESRA